MLSVWAGRPSIFMPIQVCLVTCFCLSAWIAQCPVDLVDLVPLANVLKVQLFTN